MWKEYRNIQVLDTGPQVHSTAFQQPRSEAQADGGIMVAAGQDHCGPGVGDAYQRLIQQFHDVESRQRTIVDIAGDQDDVNGLRGDEGDQLVHEAALRVKHPDTVERPAKVPVRGMK